MIEGAGGRRVAGAGVWAWVSQSRAEARVCESQISKSQISEIIVVPASFWQRSPGTRVPTSASRDTMPGRRSVAHGSPRRCGRCSDDRGRRTDDGFWRPRQRDRGAVVVRPHPKRGRISHLEYERLSLFGACLFSGGARCRGRPGRPHWRWPGIRRYRRSRSRASLHRSPQESYRRGR